MKDIVWFGIGLMVGYALANGGNLPGQQMIKATTGKVEPSNSGLLRPYSPAPAYRPPAGVGSNIKFPKIHSTI